VVEAFDSLKLGVEMAPWSKALFSFEKFIPMEEVSEYIRVPSLESNMNFQMTFFAHFKRNIYVPMTTAYLIIGFI
jgi:hypothetical protein